MDAYLQKLADTHADDFLAFLTGELHPQLQSQYRVSESGHGLFGYSYGGLFSLYAWLTGASTFATVGAGSPGVVVPGSQVFALIPDATNDAKLHVTLNEAETLGPIPIYRGLARHVLEVLEQLHAKGSPVTTAMLRETHVTGLQASFLSYLKTCHAR